MGEVIGVELTRTELVTLKETIELAPVFEGRAEARDAIRAVLRESRRSPSRLSIDENAVAALARCVLPIDVPSSALQAKLKRALERNRVTAEAR
jgi:hypothetical protein